MSLIPLPKWNKLGNPWPSVETFYKLIGARAENGLAKSGALVRVGGRWFVDPALFEAWMRAQNGKPVRVKPARKAAA